MPAISVIVPVYQAEKLLPQCVDSVLAQTFSDWELLLIDDGSRDGSPALCDGYAARDHQEGHDLELQNIQIFQGAHNGGNEQHAHVVDEKLGGSLNGTLLHPAAEQQNQQDDEADHTGRQCEGQQRGDPLTGHADEKDHAEFDDQIQNNHLNL